MKTLPPPQLVGAIHMLWAKHPDEQAFDHALAAFRKTCSELYAGMGAVESLKWALDYALRSFGLPHKLPSSHRHLAMPVEEVAVQLHNAFCSTHVEHVHLCPLDCADDIPEITFGEVEIRRFSPRELEELVDIQQLRRIHPTWTMDSDGLARFTWLVVREKVALPRSAEQRALPFMFEFVSRDLGSIAPHESRFPAPVENALFTLLLGPWEEWGFYANVEWRGFFLPWIYTVNSDVFVHRNTPPLSATLSWEPFAYTDSMGEVVEGERPCSYAMSDRVSEAKTFFVDDLWENVAVARSSLLFGAPISHFLVRGFFCRGIDEFLAHVSAIEAALGAKSDHDRKARLKLPNWDPGATDRVSLRIAGLLDEVQSAVDFHRLFVARSEFLHGQEMPDIPGMDRLLARRLARRVAAALVSTAAAEPSLPRGEFLERMLVAGRRVCGAKWKGRPGS